MNYTMLTNWTTLDGTFNSNVATASTMDSALVKFHSKIPSMINDTNVLKFTMILANENGIKQRVESWERAVEPEEDPVEAEIAETE